MLSSLVSPASVAAVDERTAADADEDTIVTLYPTTDEHDTDDYRTKDELVTEMMQLKDDRKSATGSSGSSSAPTGIACHSKQRCKCRRSSIRLRFMSYRP